VTTIVNPPPILDRFLRSRRLWRIGRRRIRHGRHIFMRPPPNSSRACLSAISFLSRPANN
jgi:hypothetical protein